MECKDPNYVGVVDDQGREAAVCIVITEELKLEGLAREVIRLVNQARKKAGLDISDTIKLYLHSPDELLAKSLVVWREAIGEEARISEWSAVPLGGSSLATSGLADGRSLTIEFRK